MIGFFPPSTVMSALAGVALLGAPPQGVALTYDKGKVTLERLEDYQTCQGRFDNPMLCHDALGEWVKGHPQDAFQAGIVTVRVMHPHWALPFFTLAFQGKAGSCAEETVCRAVIGGLEQDDPSVVSSAQKIGFSQCAQECQSSVLEAISQDATVLKNSCEYLMSKGLLHGLQAKRCEGMKK